MILRRLFLTALFSSLLALPALAQTDFPLDARPKGMPSEGTPPPFPAGNRLAFDLYAPKPYSTMIAQKWRIAGDEAATSRKMGSVPEYMFAQADINGDGKSELFVRHSDPVLGYCDADGFYCRMYIYVVTNVGLVEVGRADVADPVIVLPAKTKGINDVMVVAGGKRVTLKWSERSYEPAP